MRADIPQISFADVEFLRQGVRLDPLLEKISGFIGKHPELPEAIRGDLERGVKNPKTGRRGLSANQVLRSLILMRVKNWDYRELRERIMRCAAEPLHKLRPVIVTAIRMPSSVLF